MKPYRRYSAFMLAFLLCQTVAIALFNITVDPYGVMNTSTRVGFNKVKPEKQNQVRLFKALDIIHVKPRMIFLGSSRAELGLDPSHPVLVNDQPAYNLGITDANMYEAMRYFEHAIANQPNLKRVVIGIDFFMFNKYKGNQVDFRERRLEKSRITFKDFIKANLSLDGAIGSVKTIITNRKYPEAIGFFYPNGRRDAQYYINSIYFGRPIEVVIKQILKNGVFQEKNTYEISESYLNNLQTIVSKCKERGIDLKIFISPSHAVEWESLRVAGVWQLFEQWKREVVKIAPVWDFSGYNSITTEPISQNMKNYIEYSHYRTIVGDLVLNRMFQYEEKSVPADFGVLVTRENIEAQMKKIRADREAWAKKNADVVKFVEDLKRS